MDILALDRDLISHLRSTDTMSQLVVEMSRLNKIVSTTKKSSSNTSFPNRLIAKLDEKKKKIERRIRERRSQHTLKMYLLESAYLIREFKNILNKPVQLSFMGPKIVPTREKDAVIKKYLKVHKKYKPNAKPEVETKCESAGVKCTRPQCNSVDFITSDQSKICSECFTLQSDLTNPTSSYSDIERINISSKYLYDRKVHFRDCILQFQGRQNVTIDTTVYEALEDEFQKHHLLIGDSNTPLTIRFSNITKEHISIFLKELRLSKHYENCQLLHYNLTGKPPPDISHVEGALLEDFEKLTELYDKKYKKDARKNFVNSQYILFQLLKRHKFDCKATDFAILKTADRRNWHHSVCKDLFGTLSWNFTSI